MTIIVYVIPYDFHDQIQGQMITTSKDHTKKWSNFVISNQIIIMKDASNG
jgi:hypothetical protein